MKKRVVLYPLMLVALLTVTGAQIFADTIRLKDGTVIRGQIIGFREQQFTVLIGAGDRGRRSRIMLYMEDVDSIEFDASTGAANAASDTGNNTAATAPTNTPTNNNNAPRPTPAPPNSTTTTPRPASSNSNFFPVTVRVRADSTTNGWTNSGLVVRKGQRLRVVASGRVSLGSGRFSTPAGIGTLTDGAKLMQNEATGALIAVIGDDNDDFILIGGRNEFTAQRDGVLFLGINEGDLTDNTGAYDVTIEAETATRAAR